MKLNVGHLYGCCDGQVSFTSANFKEDEIFNAYSESVEWF